MKRAEIFLIKKFNIDEALVRIRVFCEKLELFDQLFTLGTIFLELISHARHEVKGYRRDSYEIEDIADRTDELSFDYVDCHVINEPFQSNLYLRKGLSKGDSGSWAQ